MRRPLQKHGSADTLIVIASSSEMTPDALAYINALIVNFIDQMGGQFIVPVIVPYGKYMGANVNTIALFTTVRGVASMVSTLWMPRLSDKRGRKLIILFSLFGCSFGYFTQGASSLVAKNLAIPCFMVGASIQGFFSGTQAVLPAYITEISGGNQDLTKFRLVMLQVINQGAQIVLQPIAGCLATLGLPIPFFLCVGVGLIGSLWTWSVFKEAKDVLELCKGDARTPQVAPSQERQSASLPQSSTSQQEMTSPPSSLTLLSGEPEREEGNPLFDKVILLCFGGFLAIFIFVTSLNLIVPVMLDLPTFGLQQATPEATEKEIAKHQGLVAVPLGLCQILTAIAIYAPVTKKLGEVPVLVFAGVVACVSFGSYGFWIKHLWQLMVMQGVGGVCFGLLIPSVFPLIARYSSVHYKKKMAVCQAIPMLGMQISWTFGQNFMSPVLTHWKGEEGIKYCWIIVAACILTFTILISIACTLVDRRAPKQNTLTSVSEHGPDPP